MIRLVSLRAGSCRLLRVTGITASEMAGSSTAAFRRMSSMKKRVAYARVLEQARKAAPELPAPRARSPREQQAAELVKTDVPAAQALYTADLEKASSSNDFRTVQELTQEMRSLNIPLDVVAFNALIRTSALTRRTKEMDRYKKEMEISFLQPTVATYTALIQGYSRREDLESAVQVFGEMAKRRVAADEVCYIAMIDTVGRNAGAGGAALLQALVDGARKTLSPLSTNFYTSVVEAYLRLAAHSKNTPFFESIVQRDDRRQNLIRAIDTIQQMRDAGVPPDFKTWTTFTTLFAKIGHKHKDVPTFTGIFKKGDGQQLSKATDDTLQALADKIKSLPLEFK